MAQFKHKYMLIQFFENKNNGFLKQWVHYIYHAHILANNSVHCSGAIFSICLLFYFVHYNVCILLLFSMNGCIYPPSYIKHDE